MDAGGAGGFQTPKEEGPRWVTITDSSRKKTQEFFGLRRGNRGMCFSRMFTSFSPSSLFFFPHSLRFPTPGSPEQKFEIAGEGEEGEPPKRKRREKMTSISIREWFGPGAAAQRNEVFFFEPFSFHAPKVPLLVSLSSFARFPKVMTTSGRVFFQMPF